MSYFTTEPDSEPQYTPAEYAQFTALRQELKLTGASRRETREIASAVQLAPLLRAARVHLATFRPKVCTICGHVFSPSGRVDGRCLDCAPHPIARGIAPLPGGD